MMYLCFITYYQRINTHTNIIINIVLHIEETSSTLLL